MPAPILDATFADAFDVLTGVLLAGMMAGAVYTDLRRQRIPNVLTLGGAAAGLLLNLVSGGPEGALVSAEGWLLGAGLFFVFFALGAMGAGDVKLLAAVGALKGPPFLLSAFVLTGIAGGIIAIIVLVQRRRVGYAVAGVTRQVRTLVYTGGISQPGDPKSSPLRFPYGLAIAVGSVAALFWRL